MTSTTVDTSINGTHKQCVQEVYGPDLFGPCKGQPAWLTNQQNLRAIQTSEVVAVHHSTRYVPVKHCRLCLAYVIRDTVNGEYLRTENGDEYVAEPESAFQEADRLNTKNDWSRTGQ